MEHIQQSVTNHKFLVCLATPSGKIHVQKGGKNAFRTMWLDVIDDGGVCACAHSAGCAFSQTQCNAHCDALFAGVLACEHVVCMPGVRQEAQFPYGAWHTGAARPRARHRGTKGLHRAPLGAAILRGTSSDARLPIPRLPPRFPDFPDFRFPFPFPRSLRKWQVRNS